MKKMSKKKVVKKRMIKKTRYNKKEEQRRNEKIKEYFEERNQMSLTNGLYLYSSHRGEWTMTDHRGTKKYFFCRKDVAIARAKEYTGEIIYTVDKEDFFKDEYLGSGEFDIDVMSKEFIKRGEEKFKPHEAFLKSLNAAIEIEEEEIKSHKNHITLLKKLRVSTVKAGKK